MDANGHTVATPRDDSNSALDHGMLDELQSGYVQRAKNTMPRQGSTEPWKVLMHYEKDTTMLREDAIDDGLLQFAAPVPVDAIA